MSKSRDEEGGGNAIAWLLILLALVITAFTTWYARRRAIQGETYMVVKACAWPGPFIMTQMFGAMFLLTVGFITLFFSKTMGQTIWNSIPDLCLLPLLLHYWLPTWHFETHLGLVILWQLVLWWFIGRLLAREWAVMIYDNAIFNVAAQIGFKPFDVRLNKINSDPSYRRVSKYYEDRQRIPQFSGYLIAAIGKNPFKFYRSINFN